MDIVKDIKSNSILRESFFTLAKNTFGIDFREWYELGLWNKNYKAYCIKDGNKIISNVSVNPMKAIINGEIKKIAQIGTVMTDKDHRKEGLSRRLMEEVMNEYRNKTDLIYLFPNESVMKFYPKFGFKKGIDNIFIYYPERIKNSNTKLIRMNIRNTKDRNLLRKLFNSRIPNSNIFHLINYWHVFGFYLVFDPPGGIYFDKYTNTVLVYKYKEGVLHLFDVLMQKRLTFKELISMTGIEDIKEVRFYFRPEFDDIDENDYELKFNEDVFVDRRILFTKDSDSCHNAMGHA